MASFITRIFGGKKKKAQPYSAPAPKAAAAPKATPSPEMAPAQAADTGGGVKKPYQRLKRPAGATRTKVTGPLGLSASMRTQVIRKVLLGE